MANYRIMQFPLIKKEMPMTIAVGDWVKFRNYKNLAVGEVTGRTPKGVIVSEYSIYVPLEDILEVRTPTGSTRGRELPVG
jgi:hypothetical protein